MATSTKDRRMLARWQSRGGKTWICLYADADGYGYTGNDCGGYLGVLPDDATAIAELQRRVESYLTPDAHTQPLQRVTA